MVKKNGFTLIEAMVTVAIIGLIAAIIYVGLQSSRALARDRRRIADVNLTAAALKIYLTETRRFDVQPDTACLEGWDCSRDGTFVEFLIPTYIDQTPLDPAYPHSTTTYYLMNAYPGEGDITTDGCRRPFYVVMARLEGNNGKNDQSCWTGFAFGADNYFVTVLQ